ncbi:MAG: hypothetical protein MK110_00115 [Fuerstiella sp.]|nr:hypothetical protein [Fuerstiella sp.]
MKSRLTCLLLYVSLILLPGCARLSNMMAFNGVSDVPKLTEPVLDDE